MNLEPMMNSKQRAGCAVSALLGIVLLAGCKTTAEYTAEEAPLWSRPSSTFEDFSADRKTCADYVELALYEESYVSPIRRMSAAERYQEANWWARNEYISCMQEKAWEPVPGARIGAPPDIHYP